VILLSTIKNIQNVLEEQETAAWQKLIRVLTHEIMNSIAPISSLVVHRRDPWSSPITSGEKNMPEIDLETIQRDPGGPSNHQQAQYGTDEFCGDLPKPDKNPGSQFRQWYSMKELIKQCASSDEKGCPEKKHLPGHRH
jgi:hypothetical protein